MAVRAGGILAVCPHDLGGALLRGSPGPHLDGWLKQVQALLPAGTPFRRLPARMDVGRLVGEVDVAASLRTGRREVRTGLLTEYDGGVLYVPMAERMDPEQATLLGQVLDSGTVPARSAGMEPAPARLALILLDESRGDEAGPPALLGERAGLHLELAPVADAGPGIRWPDAAEVVRARETYPEISATGETLSALVGLAGQLGIDSMRAPLQALAAARAHAALAGRRRVEDDDLAAAAALVLLPRATRLPAAEPEAGEEPAPPPPPPPDTRDESDEGDRDDEVQAGPLADRILEAAQAALPDGTQILEALQRSAAARSGRRGALIRQLRDGHRVGARPGDPRRAGRLDLSATLRTAAPWQPVRRRERPDHPARVIVEPGDLHVQVRARRSATATVFAVDASGSQALNRLAEVKGAVELLLGDSYVRREEVALVVFRGTGAEVVLPPTRSLVRARRALAGLPGGGGTPLALGLLESLRVALRLRAEEASPRVVCLSDGRPNVNREGKGGRKAAREDALAAARLFLDQGIPLLVLDTSQRGERFAAELADAAGGRALHLPRADARKMRAAVNLLPG